VRETNEGNAAEIDEGVEAPATGLDELQMLILSMILILLFNLIYLIQEYGIHLILKWLILKISMGPLDILEFLKKRPFYPNAIIAYRILLTIPVTVPSAERSFSKLKLLKSYMCSTMTQERLNGLSMISIESDVFEDTDYECIIEDFISRNTRRMLLFSRT
jgi:hypothetical protein